MESRAGEGRCGSEHYTVKICDSGNVSMVNIWRLRAMLSAGVSS